MTFTFLHIYLAKQISKDLFSFIQFHSRVVWFLGERGSILLKLNILGLWKWGLENYLNWVFPGRFKILFFIGRNAFLECLQKVPLLTLTMTINQHWTEQILINNNLHKKTVNKLYSLIKEILWFIFFSMKLRNRKFFFWSNKEKTGF